MVGTGEGEGKETGGRGKKRKGGLGREKGQEEAQGQERGKSCPHSYF